MLDPGSVDDVPGFEPCSEEDTPLAPYVTEEENENRDVSIIQWGLLVADAVP